MRRRPDADATPRTCREPRRSLMRIRAGYEIVYDCPAPTPMLLVLNVHPSRAGALLTPDRIDFDPPLEASLYRDMFGNTCHRILAPPGRLRISSGFVARDSGAPDEQPPETEQVPVELL